MKKCAKSFEYCSDTSLKRAGTTVGMKKSPVNFKKKIKNLSSPEETPQAPHNTTDFLMDQHEIKLFDPEELLGELLGTTFYQSGLNLKYCLH